MKLWEFTEQNTARLLLFLADYTCEQVVPERFVLKFGGVKEIEGGRSPRHPSFWKSEE